MAHHAPTTPPECETCPLPDCYDTDPRCPVLHRKARERGVSLPGPCGGGSKGNGTRKRSSIAPAEYTDRADYLRKYHKQYRRVCVPGIKIRRCDLELLQKTCEREGRSFAAEIVAVLEGMATRARAAGNSRNR